MHGGDTNHSAAIPSWNDALGYDGKGNITAIGASAYGYSSENLMTSAPGYALTYDPLTRFYELQGTSGRRRVYDGDELIAEYHPTGALARRFVHGPGTDEPLVWYGSGGAARRFLHADERGSIVSATDGNGNPIVTQGLPDLDESSPEVDEAGLFGRTTDLHSSRRGLPAGLLRPRNVSPL